MDEFVSVRWKLNFLQQHPASFNRAGQTYPGPRGFVISCLFSLFTASHFVALLLENLWLPGLVKWINSISENDRNVEWMLYKCLMEILSSETGMVNQLNIVESEGNVEIVWPGLWRAIESLSKTTEDSEVDKKQLHKTAKKCKWISEIRGTFFVVLLVWDSNCSISMLSSN